MTRHSNHHSQRIYGQSYNISMETYQCPEPKYGVAVKYSELHPKKPSSRIPGFQKPCRCKSVSLLSTSPPTLHCCETTPPHVDIRYQAYVRRAMFKKAEYVSDCRSADRISERSCLAGHSMGFEPQLRVRPGHYVPAIISKDLLEIHVERA